MLGALLSARHHLGVTSEGLRLIPEDGSTYSLMDLLDAKGESWVCVNASQARIMEDEGMIVAGVATPKLEEFLVNYETVRRLVEL